VRRRITPGNCRRWAVRAWLEVLQVAKSQRRASVLSRPGRPRRALVRNQAVDSFEELRTFANPTFAVGWRFSGETGLEES